jgi:hypothetical protein
VWDKVKSEAEFELKQLNDLVLRYRPLLEKALATPPDEYETAAIGAMLQSFYNGIENLFKRIGLELYGD